MEAQAAVGPQATPENVPFTMRNAKLLQPHSQASADSFQRQYLRFRPPDTEFTQPGSYQMAKTYGARGPACHKYGGPGAQSAHLRGSEQTETVFRRHPQ